MKKYFILSICLIFAGVSAQVSSILFQVPEQLEEISPQITQLDVAAKQWIKVIKHIDVSRGEASLDPDIFLADGLLAENLEYCDITHYGPEDQNNYDDLNDKIIKETDYTKCLSEWFPQFDTYAKVYWYDEEDGNVAPPFHAFMHQIYASKNLRQVAYQWMAPIFKDLFADVFQDRKKILCNIMDHGEEYALSLEDSSEKLNCELNYFNAEKERVSNGIELPNRGYEDFSLFHWRRPNAACNGPKAYEEDKEPLRKLEAWIIRRYLAEHMTLKEMSAWFQKIGSEVFNCTA